LLDDYTPLARALQDLVERGEIEVSASGDTYKVMDIGRHSGMKHLIVFNIKSVNSYVITYDDKGKAEKILLSLSNGIIIEIPES